MSRVELLCSRVFPCIISSWQRVSHLSPTSPYAPLSFTSGHGPAVNGSSGRTSMRSGG